MLLQFLFNLDTLEVFLYLFPGSGMLLQVKRVIEAIQ